MDPDRRWRRFNRREWLHLTCRHRHRWGTRRSAEHRGHAWTRPAVEASWGSFLGAECDPRNRTIPVIQRNAANQIMHFHVELAFLIKLARVLTVPGTSVDLKSEATDILER